MRGDQTNMAHDCKLGKAELLVAYQAGRLDSESTILLDRHVPACPQCQQFLAGQQMVWSALDAYAPAAPTLSANFDQQLFARIAQEQAGTWWQRTWRRWFQSGEPLNWKPVGAVAFAGLAVAVGLSFRVDHKPAPVPVQIALDKQEIELVEKALEDFEMLNKMGAPAEEPIEN